MGLKRNKAMTFFTNPQHRGQRAGRTNEELSERNTMLSSLLVMKRSDDVDWAWDVVVTLFDECYF